MTMATAIIIMATITVTTMITIMGQARDIDATSGAAPCPRVGG